MPEDSVSTIESNYIKDFFYDVSANLKQGCQISIAYPTLTSTAPNCKYGSLKTCRLRLNTLGALLKHLSIK